jgi:hypothetical protein
MLPDVKRRVNVGGCATRYEEVVGGGADVEHQQDATHPTLNVEQGREDHTGR